MCSHCSRAGGCIVTAVASRKRSRRTNGDGRLTDKRTEAEDVGRTEGEEESRRRTTTDWTETNGQRKTTTDRWDGRTENDDIIVSFIHDTIHFFIYWCSRLLICFVSVSICSLIHGFVMFHYVFIFIFHFIKQFTNCWFSHT